MLDEVRSLTDGLPDRSLQILFKLLEGHTEKEIARIVGRTPDSVHSHTKLIFKHFAVRSRSELLAMIYKQIIEDLKAKLGEQSQDH